MTREHLEKALDQAVRISLMTLDQDTISVREGYGYQDEWEELTAYLKWRKEKREGK